MERPPFAGMARAPDRASPRGPGPSSSPADRHDPPGRITTMSFYPCGLAGGKLWDEEVSVLAARRQATSCSGCPRGVRGRQGRAGPPAPARGRRRGGQAGQGAAAPVAVGLGGQPAGPGAGAGAGPPAGRGRAAARRPPGRPGRRGRRRARSAAKAEREAVAGLVETAMALLREAGHPTTDATRDRVAATLHAAAASPEAADLVRNGRLTTDLDPSGFGTAPDAAFDAAAVAARRAVAGAAGPAGAGRTPGRPRPGGRRPGGGRGRPGGQAGPAAAAVAARTTPASRPGSPPTRPCWPPARPSGWAGWPTRPSGRPAGPGPPPWRPSRRPARPASVPPRRPRACARPRTASRPTTDPVAVYAPPCGEPRRARGRGRAGDPPADPGPLGRPGHPVRPAGRPQGLLVHVLPGPRPPLRAALGRRAQAAFREVVAEGRRPACSPTATAPRSAGAPSPRDAYPRVLHSRVLVHWTTRLLGSCLLLREQGERRGGVGRPAGGGRRLRRRPRRRLEGYKDTEGAGKGANEMFVGSLSMFAGPASRPAARNGRSPRRSCAGTGRISGRRPRRARR